MGEVAHSIAGFPLFLLYFLLSLVLLGAFVAAYVRVTPYREVSLIREGNTAAAISLSGAVLGFVVPLASAVAHSVSPVDMVVWGVIAFAAQIAVYLVLSRFMAGAPAAIERGSTAVATLLAGLSLAVGILNAACLTY